MEAERIVMVGVIAGAHGVRGEVRIRSFTADPRGVGDYGPLHDEAGQQRFSLRVTGAVKGGVIARIEGVEDRDAAAALRGVRLYVPRAALPQPDPEEFYHADLIGLAAERADGTPLGRVVAVQDFGADVLEIAPPPPGATLFVPFTRSAVPLVDIAGGKLVVEPPEDLQEPPLESSSTEPDADDEDPPHAEERPQGASRSTRRSGA